MKKFLFLILSIVILLSCKKEKDKTTYQIINNVTKSTSTVQYMDGSVYEIIVFHYSGNDIIHQDEIKKVEAGGGKSEMIESPDQSEKIKVSFKFLPTESPYYDLSSNARKYVVAFTLLEKGKNNTVTLTDNTMVDESLNRSDNKNNLLKAIEVVNQKIKSK